MSDLNYMSACLLHRQKKKKDIVVQVKVKKKKSKCWESVCNRSVKKTLSIPIIKIICHTETSLIIQIKRPQRSLSFCSFFRRNYYFLLLTLTQYSVLALLLMDAKKITVIK